jgi:hypothetical protein
MMPCYRRALRSERGEKAEHFAFGGRMANSETEISEQQQDHAGHGHKKASLFTLCVGTVGVVFGDIGTSPIYAFRETFASHHRRAGDSG